VADALPTVSVRREFESDGVEPAVIGDIERRLSLWERISNVSAVRKLTVLVVMLIAWEVYVQVGEVSEYILPAFSSTGSAFFDAITVEGLARKVWNSITVLLAGYIIGIAIASLLTTLAVATRFGSDLLSTLTAMLNPLPAIALLPMAMLWFGLGKEAIVFTLLHSVIWPVALNMHTGFMGVSDTQRMVGRNYGLRGLSYVIKLLIPAAFPSILTGMKIGWAYAWRTLIAAELVFGGSVIDAAGTDAGGLGWFIFSNQMDMRIPYVFAGLFTVILVGVLMESIVFRNLETRTVIRWGMQDQ
jgi:NitT/TauT family transport system permease protein